MRQRTIHCWLRDLTSKWYGWLISLGLVAFNGSWKREFLKRFDLTLSFEWRFDALGDGRTGLTKQVVLEDEKAEMFVSHVQWWRPLFRAKLPIWRDSGTLSALGLRLSAH